MPNRLQMIRQELEARRAEVSKSLDVEVCKVDADLGIVFGYAIVCKIGDEDYFDVQGDNIPEASMLDATADFMSGSRMAKDSHRGDCIGQVVYGFPITKDIASSLGLTVEKTGFVVGMKPESEQLLEKYKSGEYTGFSIGGRRISDQEV